MEEKVNLEGTKKVTGTILLADIRNSAAHGKDSEFSHENVENMIRDIEIFLGTYLTK